jgi:excisionase family DNA binding protein
MRESLDLPNLPEYVTIKDAAKILGVSDKRVYAYIEEGRLPAVRAAHVIMIPVKEVKKFKPNISGRPRKNTPAWRTAPPDNQLITNSIFVRLQGEKQQQLEQKLEEIRRAGEQIFSGTVARYVIQDKAHAGEIEILLIWRSASLPDDPTREEALDEFLHALSDIVDIQTARYREGRGLLHT